MHPVARLSAKALRPYDGLGLLVPERADPDSGCRWYAPGQVERARPVAALVRGAGGADQGDPRGAGRAPGRGDRRRVPGLTPRTEPAHEDAYVRDEAPAAGTGATQAENAIVALAT